MTPSNKKNPPSCPYCKKTAVLIRGNVLYQHRDYLHKLFFWICNPCNAYVGCHKKSRHSDGTVPLGRLANAHLRALRSKAHESFDLLWDGGPLTRSEAYAWLRQKMNLPAELAHIGMFDDAQCCELLDLLAGRVQGQRLVSHLFITALKKARRNTAR
jgi:hypothetical protein